MKYNPNEFINALSKKIEDKEIRCPICNGAKFTTTENFATITIGSDLDSIHLGPNIPAGMLVCENCGRIEFFALGALNLLKRSNDEK